MGIIASAILATAIPVTTNVSEQVAILWAAHTNRLARVEQTVSRKGGRKSATDQVRENLKNRKRRSAFGKSAGGVK